SHFSGQWITEIILSACGHHLFRCIDAGTITRPAPRPCLTADLVAHRLAASWPERTGGSQHFVSSTIFPSGRNQSAVFNKPPGPPRTAVVSVPPANSAIRGSRMEFLLTADQQRLVSLCQKLGAEVLEPQAAERDRQHVYPREPMLALSR